MHRNSWLVKSLVEERYDSLAAAKKIRCPALFIHGEHDDLIPVSQQGEKVAGAVPSATRWVQVPQAGHNDLLGRRLVWLEIAKLLSEL